MVRGGESFWLIMVEKVFNVFDELNLFFEIYQRFFMCVEHVFPQVLHEIVINTCLQFDQTITLTLFLVHASRMQDSQFIRVYKQQPRLYDHQW